MCNKFLTIHCMRNVSLQAANQAVQLHSAHLGPPLISPRPFTLLSNYNVVLGPTLLSSNIYLPLD